MSHRLTRQFRNGSGAIGLMLAVLALISHFALSSIVLPDPADLVQQAELDALTILCNQPAPHQHHDHAPRPDSGRDGVLCPLSVSAALHSVILGAAPMLPPPAARPMSGLAEVAPARAPPRSAPVEPYPTGPPLLA
jgi:hypothetical protein